MALPNSAAAQDEAWLPLDHSSISFWMLTLDKHFHLTTKTNHHTVIEAVSKGILESRNVQVCSEE